MTTLFGEVLVSVIRDAEISGCGRYRWSLSRIWGEAAPVGFIMLNPSIADASIDDQTIRKCVAFARSWGHDGIVVRNLFNLRATDPRELYKHEDPVGDRAKADAMITSLFDVCPLVVAAWGAHGLHRDRAEQVCRLVQVLGKKLHCLKLTKGGQPQHPLYLKGDSQPFPFVA